MENFSLNVGRLRILREFAAVESVTAVADALWLTPSAVSQQLRTLEKETGRSLTERVGRNVRLTPAGLVLARESEPVFEALDACSAALRATDSEPAGLLRVACLPSVARVVLPSVTSLLRRRYPKLQVEIEDLEDEPGLNGLRLGRVDVAIVDSFGWSQAVGQGDMAVIELFEDRLLVVLPPDHPLVDHGTISWPELAPYDIVTESRASSFGIAVEQGCRYNGFEPNIHTRVNDAAAIIAFVEAGDSIAVLPELAMVGSSHQAIECRPLQPSEPRRLKAATRRAVLETPPGRALVDHLTEFDPADILAPLLKVEQR